MDDFIEAMNIFRKYKNEHFPFYCNHDIFCVCVEYDSVTEEDKKRLEDLSFTEDTDYDCGFKSYRFGSC